MTTLIIIVSRKGTPPFPWTSTRGQRASASLLSVGNDYIHNYRILKGDTSLPMDLNKGPEGLDLSIIGRQ
jgi:hypothetical protein